MKASTTIISLNVVVFLILVTLSIYDSDFGTNLIAWSPSSENFNYFQLITYQFVHVNATHILFNMLLFSFCAFDIEKKLGWKKFVLFYLISGTLAGLSHILISESPVAGASGSIWGLMIIYSFLFPKSNFETSFSKVPIVILVGILFLLEIFFLFTGLDKGVSNIAHIVGGLTGLLLILINQRFRIKFSK